MLGVFSGIGAALSWTIACYLWRKEGKYMSSIQLNLLKNISASIIFLPTLFGYSWIFNSKESVLLIISGIIGIGIGDTLYIKALKLIGTRRTLTIEALSPILANCGSTFIAKETIPEKVWVGAILVVTSLILIANRSKEEKIINKVPKKMKTGLLCGFFSVICAVVGALLSREVLTSSEINPFESTEIRLIGAIIFLLPLVKIKCKNIVQITNKRNILVLLLASFIGTNIGILLQQVVFKVLPIGVAWTLLSTSPVISLAFARAEGDKIDKFSIFFALIALLGVSIALL